MGSMSAMSTHQAICTQEKEGDAENKGRAQEKEGWASVTHHPSFTISRHQWEQTLGHVCRDTQCTNDDDDDDDDDGG
eukprot:scaffold208620_cov21-Tisochrysis_lutea.AAC.3